MLRVTLAAVAMLVLAGAALAQAPVPDLPAALNPGDLKPYLAVPAKGVQIYLCNKTDSGPYAWAFKAPEAELDDSAGIRIGKHYGGPTWEANDGGKVVGAVKASAPAPAANAIPWLLLDIKAREASGRFTQAASILRVNTVGGQAPAAGCDEPRAGAELRVPYTATYYFLK
ncbi:MAG TPA: DUF3455 domain-containing protein [Xanthobacteraceae bacterium]|nr:DUF3455 domain-containing protein [Xanthobacteraceae bacterium]